MTEQKRRKGRCWANGWRMLWQIIDRQLTISSHLANGYGRLMERLMLANGYGKSLIDSSQTTRICLAISSHLARIWPTATPTVARKWLASGRQGMQTAANERMRIFMGIWQHLSLISFISCQLLDRTMLPKIPIHIWSLESWGPAKEMHTSDIYCMS